jgi:hypothetical protein
MWVDAHNEKYNNDGKTYSTARRIINRAARLAAPGTDVHILPGICRVAVTLALDVVVTAGG